MSAMAKLRPHVDAFFDKVTVNVDDKALRENRLKLLNEIREATRAVADFSKIEGSLLRPPRHATTARKRKLNSRTCSRARGIGSAIRRCIAAANPRGTPPWSSASDICSPSSRSSPASLILIMPRLLNFIVATYLILVGVIGSRPDQVSFGLIRNPGLRRRGWRCF